MKYIDSIKQDMKYLSQQKDVVFIGQGIIKGDRIYHTLDEVPLSSCIEMPIAENLIMGVANGLAIKGYRPVVIFQRMDFLLIAGDQIINHTALIKEMSNGQYQCPVIIRTCIGSQCSKFDVGCQHSHDFRHMFKPYIKVWDYTPHIYEVAYNQLEPVMIVEEKDLYESNTKY